MKIRQGFVSNSSSSSFIIAYNTNINLHEVLTEELTRLGQGNQSKMIQEHLLSRVESTYNIEDIDNWNDNVIDNFLYEIPYMLKYVIIAGDWDKYESYLNEPIDSSVRSIILNVIKNLCKSHNISTVLYGSMEDCSNNMLDVELSHTKIEIIEPDIKVYNDPRN